MADYIVSLWPPNSPQPTSKTEVKASDLMEAAAKGARDFNAMGHDVAGARKVHVVGPDTPPDGVVMDPETVADWMHQHPGPYSDDD